MDEFNSTNLNGSNDSSQLALMMAAASGFPLLAALAAANSGTNANNNNNNNLSTTPNTDSMGGSASVDTCSDSGSSPQKRARTRITDKQLQILRQYFDINNSPSEEQIKEMNKKAQLPEKVIKHWFRNTLFKVKILYFIIF